ncbi:MAG TPA: D-alanyl-D-alanine carboxypeptidase [Alphaproteobacteria bacterium]|nr:D-alanyl-D-alanine carboxypeptidase [Alphaproteobacteria bacterium]
MDVGAHGTGRFFPRLPGHTGRAILSCLLVICAFLAAPAARAIDGSIVIDADTNTVISEDHPDRLLHPASMSKLMTLYLTFEALEQGRLTLQRSLPVSAHAASMSPSKLGLEPGDTIKVDDAILALTTHSANDVAVVLAEAIGGSEGRFGQLMTRKAHQLGMVNSNFRNASGLPDPAQISTPRDMAILARAIIRTFPEYYHYFSVREFAYNGVVYPNHNHLMSRYEGMDGLKTGLTNASGFNLAASAVRGGRRLIGVVFGGTSAAQRDNYMADLLDDGFARKGGVAMASATPVPVPGHKPTEVAEAPPPAPTAAKPSDIASLAAAASLGQGDTTAPDDVRPVATPKVATLSSPHALSPSPAAKQAGWTIQVGAFATRRATEQAIERAVKGAPELLSHATAVIAALPHRTHTLYRARLTGLEAAEAQKACRLLIHCRTLPPGA